MRLLSRVRRIARVLATRPPFDPRRTLSAEARDAADEVLEKMAAEPPEPVEAELADWFEEAIRPRLLSWLLFERRRHEWAAEKRAEFQAAQYRRTQARMGYFSVDSPVFSGKIRAVVLRLLGLDAAAEAAAA